MAAGTEDPRKAQGFPDHTDPERDVGVNFLHPNELVASDCISSELITRSGATKICVVNSQGPEARIVCA